MKTVAFPVGKALLPFRVAALDLGWKKVVIAVNDGRTVQVHLFVIPQTDDRSILREHRNIYRKFLKNAEVVAYEDPLSPSFYKAGTVSYAKLNKVVSQLVTALPDSTVDIPVKAGGIVKSLGYSNRKELRQAIARKYSILKKQIPPGLKMLTADVCDALALLEYLSVKFSQCANRNQQC